MSQLTGPAAVREVVERKLRGLDGSVEVDDRGDFVVHRGSDVVRIRLLGLQPDLTVVVVLAVVASRLRDVVGACQFLATESLGLPLAHFELHGDGGVLVASHSLVGEYLSRQELRAAIDAVTGAAAHYGPVVRERFGSDPEPEPEPVGAAESPAQVALQSVLVDLLGEAVRGQRRRRADVRRALVLTLLGLAVLVLSAGAVWRWWA